MYYLLFGLLFLGSGGGLQYKKCHSFTTPKKREAYKRKISVLKARKCNSLPTRRKRELCKRQKMVPKAVKCKVVYLRYERELGGLKKAFMDSSHKKFALSRSSLWDLESFYPTCFNTIEGKRLLARKKLVFRANGMSIEGLFNSSVRRQKYRSAQRNGKSRKGKRFRIRRPSRKGKIFKMIGLSMFSTAYLIPAGVGTLIWTFGDKSYPVGYSWIPVAGSFFLAKFLFEIAFEADLMSMALLFIPNIMVGIVGVVAAMLGVAQVVGLIFAMRGISLSRRNLLAFRFKVRSVRAQVLPWASGRAAGIGIVGRF